MKLAHHAGVVSCEHTPRLHGRSLIAFVQLDWIECQDPNGPNFMDRNVIRGLPQPNAALSFLTTSCPLVPLRFAGARLCLLPQLLGGLERHTSM